MEGLIWVLRRVHKRVWAPVSKDLGFASVGFWASGLGASGLGVEGVEMVVLVVAIVVGSSRRGGAGVGAGSADKSISMNYWSRADSWVEWHAVQWQQQESTSSRAWGSAAKPQCMSARVENETLYPNRVHCGLVLARWEAKKIEEQQCSGKTPSLRSLK